MTGGPPVDDPTPSDHTPAWARTDRRMLLITITRALSSLALPVLLVLFGIGRRSEDTGWLVVVIGGSVLAVAFGTAAWLTTRYRFDGARLVVRTGVLSRTVRTVQADRVRNVELEASLLHRVLGLAKVTIGTGSGEERITLDSLSREKSARLRSELLRRRHDAQQTAPQPDVAAPAAGTPPAETPPAASPPAETRPAASPPDAGQVLAVFDPSWVRFALASRGGVALLGALGGGYALLRQIGDGDEILRGLLGWATTLSTVVLVVGGLAVVVVVGSALSAASYAQTWWGLRLVREPGTLHVSRGLTTTTSRTLEEARIRGVELTERLVLRVLGGARLRVLTTGVGTGGTADVLPACPRDVATTVGRQILDRPQTGPQDAVGPRTDDGLATDPLTVTTQRHGPRAARRAHVGAQGDTVVLWAMAAGVIAWRDWSWWLLVGAVPWALVAAALAVVAHRTRGYALTAHHLVVTDGVLRRRRIVLERRGIIGWTISQSVLQRRVGLATLMATTAAGPEKVEIHDVPLPRALAVVAEATPEVVVPFLAGASPGPHESR